MNDEINYYEYYCDVCGRITIISDSNNSIELCQYSHEPEEE